MRNGDVGTEERYFGPTSLPSLALAIKDAIIEHLDPETERSREYALLVEQKIDAIISRGEGIMTRGGHLPTVPPFTILDAMIEPYFTAISPHFPIWTKSKFIQMATDLRCSPAPDEDLASIICCNNLILMTLTANSLCFRRGSIPQDKQARKTSSLDLDVTAGFLANSKRAISNVGSLLAPSVINVQALISLCVVAQEHLPSSTFETLFGLTAQVAKAVGIHQWHSFRSQLGDEESLERRNISYCLYILDKTVCWTTGTSPSIPVSDIYTEPIEASETSSETYLTTKVELAMIQETIYSEMYACRMDGRNEDEIRQIVSRTWQGLETWMVNSGTDLDGVEKALEYPSLKFEMAIGCLYSQLLLIWPYGDHLDTMFQQRTEIARRYMKMILGFWNLASDPGHHSILTRIIASQSPLYLHEMFVRIIGGQGQDSDIDMLRKFSEMIQTVTDAREETSYGRRLYELSHILVDFLDIIKTKHKRRRVDSTSEETSSLSSTQYDLFGSFRGMDLDTSYFLGTGIGNPSPKPKATEPRRSYSDLNLRQWLDPLGIVGSASSGVAERRNSRPTDEFASIMGAYANGVFDSPSSPIYEP
ncbi:uncharacterized protein F4822DRAFT_403099 [Hypoxylon trugodes]|uniref:uncharacterized protein n=1 Tax=Hypoxylon trugodes TaxID=326681 RepID=UPI0021957D8B|nr:uncharacterized protein F4822DRAFT_403099 [Hypoxylon trugodes]KAI1388531.1 hypothetical protein F4822DRAFT_403099 [Hypoxylon trugodes]